MWNKISRYALWVVIGVSMLLTSCGKEEGRYYMSVSYGNIVGSTESFQIVTDEGATLNIVENNASGVEVEDGQRVMANYTILEKVESGYNVRLNLLYNILTKSPVYLSQMTPEEQNELGNDPVNVLSMVFGGKYLNAKVEVWRKDPSLAHFINLVVDEQRSDDQTVYLTWRHNAYEDPTSLPVAQRVSFDLSKLVPEGKQQINVCVEWTDYQGVKRQDSGVFTLPSGANQ